MILELLGITVSPQRKIDKNRISKAATRIAATLTGLAPEKLVVVTASSATEKNKFKNMDFVTQLTYQGHTVCVFNETEGGNTRAVN